MTLSDRVIKGASWSLAARISSQFAQLAFLVVLARLLSPEDYGRMAMLAVFTGFAQGIADGGLGSALIQNQQVSDRHLSTAFWIQLGLALGLSGLFFVGAPAIASFYASPDLESLSRLISCIFVIQAAGNVHSAILAKKFEFRALALVTLTATFGSGIAAIAMALSGFGVWALAWQSLISATSTTVLLWNRCKWRPQFIFDRSAAQDLGRYGIYLLGFTSVNYWLRNLDNLLVGRFLGAHQLGIYARAYQLMLLPITNLATAVGQVVFPAFSEIQHDPSRFKRSYLRATRLIALVSFPLMVEVSILSEPLVMVIFGPRWIEVSAVLRLLAYVGLLQSIVHPVGWIFNALGKTKASFRLSLLLAPAFVVAIGIGLQFGIIGVAVGYTVWAIVDGFLSLLVAGRYIDMTLGDVLKSVFRIVLMSGMVGAIVASLDSFLLHEAIPTIRLSIGLLIGSIAYLLLCYITKDPTFNELIRFVLPRVSTKFRRLAAEE